LTYATLPAFSKKKALKFFSSEQSVNITLAGFPDFQQKLITLAGKKNN
jgi:hypothetical protein